MCSAALKDVYEARLDEYAQKMAELHSDVHTGSGKKMTRKERLSRLAEATARDDMQVEGLPEIASNVVEPGVQQLAALTESGEWNMVVVDVKMTTKQTPQGKKSRFSAMVIVGNLNVCFSLFCRLHGPVRTWATPPPASTSHSEPHDVLWAAVMANCASCLCLFPHCRRRYAQLDEAALAG